MGCLELTGAILFCFFGIIEVIRMLVYKKCNQETSIVYYDLIAELQIDNSMITISNMYGYNAFKKKIYVKNKSNRLLDIYALLHEIGHFIRDELTKILYKKTCLTVLKIVLFIIIFIAVLTDAYRHMNTHIIHFFTLIFALYFILFVLKLIICIIEENKANSYATRVFLDVTNNYNSLKIGFFKSICIIQQVVMELIYLWVVVLIYIKECNFFI